MINTTALPNEAKAKLQSLELARMSAEDAGRAAASRLSNLSPDTDPELRARLSAERDRQGQRHGELHQLLSRLRQWLSQLPRNSVLEPAPPVDIGLKPGQTLNEGLNSIREEIAALRQQLVTVRSAPLPPDAQRDLVAAHVIRLAQAARPTVNVLPNDTLRIGWRGDMAATEDVVALLCWAMPEKICAALERELPVRPGAMPASERVKRLGELEAQLLELECREESLIMHAAGDGLEVPRRVDADARAVLNVILAKEAKAA